MPFIVPQEYGLHLDTRWFRIADGDTTIEVVTPATPLAFSALPYGADDLTAATHPHELRERPATFVHLDAVHRGLGTAACGPDTADRWRIASGTYRWRWSMSADRTRRRSMSRLEAIRTCLMPAGATRDASLLLETRGLRALGDGLVSIVLAAYLSAVGLSATCASASS